MRLTLPWLRALKPEGTGFATLLGVVFLNVAGFGVVIPLLPFFAGTFDAQPWQIALMFSAYSLGNLVGEPLWGRLSDRWGTRSVLLLTIFGNALTYVMLAFAPSIWIALAARLAGGVLTGNLGAIQNHCVAAGEAAGRAQRLGAVGAAFGAGFAVGPGLAGWLVMPSMGMAGYRVPLLLAASLCALAGVLCLFFLKSAPGRSKRPAPPRGPGRLSPRLAILFGVAFVLTLAFAAVEASFGLWSMAELGWGPREISAVFLIAGAAAALVQLFAAKRVIARLGDVGAAGLGLAVIGLGLILPSVIQAAAAAAIGVSAMAAGYALAMPSISAAIGRSADEARRGEALGVAGGVGALARVGGPAAAGGLIANLGTTAPFVAAAGLCILTGAAAVAFLCGASGADRAIANG